MKVWVYRNGSYVFISRQKPEMYGKYGLIARDSQIEMTAQTFKKHFGFVPPKRTLMKVDLDIRRS